MQIALATQAKPPSEKVIAIFSKFKAQHRSGIFDCSDGADIWDDEYFVEIDRVVTALERRKSVRKCAKLRSFEQEGRKISILEQGVMNGVKPPLWAPEYNFDTSDVQLLEKESAISLKLAGCVEVETLGAALLIAYDTEYEERDDKTNEILSYQIVALAKCGSFVEFVIHVFDGDRLGMGEIIDATRLLIDVKPKALKAGGVVIVSHFGAAEWAALEDRKYLSDYLDLVRKVPVTLKPVQVELRMNNRKVSCSLSVLDTFLLAPDGSKGLAKLGEVVGIPKIELPPGAIENMSRLRAENPDLFERYGIQDARITMAFIMKMFDLATRELGLSELPLTTGGLAVKSFLNDLGKLRYMHIFGLEERKAYKKTEKVSVTAREHVESFFAAGFAGGLNNATPSRVTPADGRVVFDIDFLSAYPAAMASLPVIDWSGSGQNGIEHGFVMTDSGGAAAPISLSYIRFQFPPETVRPCIPVDAESRGIIYPLEGEGYATGPELAMARAKGAEIEVLRKEHLPYCVDKAGRAELAFAPFLGRMIEKRREFPSESIENLLYKLICNSLYGKLAQGVKHRTVRSFSKKGTLPASSVTCPAYAAATTGIVRAALVALQDAIEEVGGVVHSATTDGCCASFPGSPDTHPDLSHIPGLMDAILGKPAIRQMQQGLLNMCLPGNPLDLKSVGDSCEIWKTRGYVIKLGETVKHVGKAGHQLSAEELSENAASSSIDRWEMKSLTSAQSIYDGKNNDLIALRESRRVNLDFDFKLIPDGRGGYRPPRDLHEFQDWRESAEAIRKSGLRATESRVAMSVVGVQLRGGETPAVKRQLLRALLQNVGGIRPAKLKDRELAELLGYSATDAKNAKRRPFQALPRTAEIERILRLVLREAGLVDPPLEALMA